MHRRRWAAAVALVGLALVVVPAADAKFALVFHRTTARPGQIVTATSPNVWPDGRQYLHGVTVYLVPTRLGHADYNTGWAVLPPPGSKHTYRLGRMTERNQRLFLRFKVPHVPPGNYMTAFWNGGTFTASGLWNEAWSAKPGYVIRITR